MIITQKEFAQAMAQVNAAFDLANDKIDKLELQVKSLIEGKTDGDSKKGKSKG